ncbi:MAG: hypothetical protein NC393_11610 [Clostridium sp.]|nr:hypothetical protein [Clostridium sp.]MCM1208604.1 hypothetical protein [Ruminococcus sp.]
MKYKKDFIYNIFKEENDMKISRLGYQSIKLSDAGVENMKKQVRAFEKYNAGEALTVEEQEIVDRANSSRLDNKAAKSLTDEAVSMKLSKLGIEKASDIPDEWNMDGKLIQVDNMMVAAFQNEKPKMTGYAKEFDDVSKEYADFVLSNKFDEASKTDVLARLNDKYNSLLKEIEKNYTGEEKEEKLKSLNDDFQTVLENNIKKPMDLMLRKELIIVDMTRQLNDAHKKAAKARYLDESIYDEIAKGLDKNEQKIKDTQDMVNQLTALFKDFGNKGTQIGSLFKTINDNIEAMYNSRIRFE